MENKEKKILFIVQYPERISPGQRFRFELYMDLLKRNGFEVTVAPFLDMKGYRIIHKQGFLFAKFIAVLKGFARRLMLMFSIKKYGYILLQREFAPVGPVFLEWLYMRVFRKKVIYDFDDAIWIPQISKNNSLGKTIKNAGKVKTICKWAYKISCGNEYLCNFAKQYNKNIVYNPTCVDTSNHHNVICNHDVERVTIGWTGSFSTLEYFYLLTPVLKKLQNNFDFDIKIICNRQPEVDLKNLKYVEWSPENEVTELATCQIGLMPLTQDAWSEGKCGFKLIQYLSLEIPAVSSPVGVNKKIIEAGVNGFLCESEDQWYDAIAKLIVDKDLRKKMGKAGRIKIINEYSLQSNSENFINLFK